jgi:hypothetical protein
VFQGGRLGRLVGMGQSTGIVLAHGCKTSKLACPCNGEVADDQNLNLDSSIPEPCDFLLLVQLLNQGIRFVTHVSFIFPIS